MITMTTYTVYEYLKQKFPELSNHLRNGNLDKGSKNSIGVFNASDTRQSGNLAIGGIDCTVTKMLPVNIQIRWSDNQREHDNQAVKIYNELLTEGNNFFVNDVKIACIMLLDGCPISLGRDEKNTCESVIRANFYYYVQEVEHNDET